MEKDEVQEFEPSSVEFGVLLGCVVVPTFQQVNKEVEL